ncbi:protein PRR14L isoform X2 [Dromaius novaehollandiae]|uniref:protein PRR14L isoform X2 n=1 Tax=Dromaius novaehollandiae TaxID=8790 RepID=UPI00311E8FED
MLSSGVESLLGSPMSAVVEELYTGLPVSISTELMAVSEPNVGLDAKSEVPTAVLAHRDSLPSEHRRTSGVENLSQKTENLGDMPKVISHGLAESPTEELLKSGDLEEDEETKKRNSRKLDSSTGGYQKEDKKGQDTEEYLAECCALTPEESWWSKQEELRLNQHGVKFSSLCCTEISGSLKNKENQANVQVTAETLPKPAEEAQGMKADGTRIFSKAGYRNDKVSKDLPPESNERTDVGTVMASDEVSETSMLVFSEPLAVRNVKSATEHPQEINECNGLKAGTVMPLTTRGNIVSILETREEKLPRQNPVKEFNTSLAVCQTYQQDEENSAHDFSTIPIPNNEPDRSSIQSSGTLSTETSEVSCSVLKGTCYLDFRNTPLESSSTAVCGVNGENQEEHLPENMESQSRHDHGTGFLGNQTSKSIPVEQLSVVGNEELSVDKTDHREVSDNIDNSYSSEFEEAAEIQRKIAMGDNVENRSWPEAREDVNSECCNSSVFSSVASSPEDFSKEKLKIVPSEAGKRKKDQRQLAVSDLRRDDTAEDSLLMETNNIVPPETEQTYVRFYNTYNENTTAPSSHGCLKLSTKLEKGSPVLQLLEKESESNITTEELSGNLVKATEANSNDSLSIGKETNLVYTLNITLPPVAQKSRVPHDNELTPCTANEVSSRDKAQDNLSGKESISASVAMEEQVTEFVLPKDKFKPSVNLETIDTPNTTSKVSQKNISLLGNIDSEVTDSENEQSDKWNCNHQSTEDQCTAASTSCILSESTHGDDDLPNSHPFKGEIETKTGESKSLKGEDSAGCNSKQAITSEKHFLSAGRPVPCEDEWGNGSVALHVISHTSIAKHMFCSASTAGKTTSTLLRDEISNKNMEVESLKQFDLDKDGNEITCDGDEAQEQISMCALQMDKFDKIGTVDSPDAPESNQRNESSEQLLVRYFIKKQCVHNFGFCNSPLGLKKRELGTYEGKDMTSLTGNLSEYSASICDSSQLCDNSNIQRPHASQPAKTICPIENQFLACQSELVGPVPDSMQNEVELADEIFETQHLEGLHKQSDTGLQTVATSVEETKISIGSSQGEEILLKNDDNLTPLVRKCVREDSFQGTVKDNTVDFDSLNHVGNADLSGYTHFVNKLTVEETIELKEPKKGCGREHKKRFEEGFSDSRTHCSQNTCSISCAKEKGELLVFAGNTVQKTLSKMECLVGDQENRVNAQSLPISAWIHGSLSDEPENMNLFSEMENKPSLRIKPMLHNSHQQLIFESGKETDVQKDIDPPQPRKFEIQEAFTKTHVDSETRTAMNLGVSLPQKEKLCMSSENTQIYEYDSSSTYIFSKDSSVTKPLSITMSVKRKASMYIYESPSSENGKTTSFLKDAKSSRVCAHSKGPTDEGDSELTLKDMDVTLPENTDCREKFKIACVEDKIEREVAPGKSLPISSTLDGGNSLQFLLEDSEQSGSKIVPPNAENYEKILEEMPRSNLKNLSKKRKNATKPTDSAGISLLSETVRDCQAEDLSDTKTSPEIQYNAIPTFYPYTSVKSNSCKESSPNCVVCREVCVPYNLNAQSKDNIKEIREGQDTTPAHSICKENKALGSEKLDQIKKCQALKRKKMYEEMEARLSDKAQQEQKSNYKAKITLQPSMLYNLKLVCSSSNELVTSRNTKLEGPSKQIFAVMSSENKLCSTLQDVKRPKITTDVISSQFLKTQDSETENLSLNLESCIKLSEDGTPLICAYHLQPQTACDEIRGAFGTTNKLRGLPPLKKQPGRACKKVPASDQPKSVRKSNKIRSSTLKTPSETFCKQENMLLNSLYFAYKPPVMETEIAMRLVHMPRQRAKRCSLLNSLKFRKCTKEPILLSKLSAMANKLLAPAKSSHNLKSLPYSSEILPVAERYSQRRAKNLLEAFSCINRNLHSHWADSWCTKMFSFQSLALYPVESTKIPFLDLSHKSPSSLLDTPVFPISFQIKLDSSSMTDLTGITSQCSVHHSQVFGEMPESPSEWTFSFLLSRSCSGTTASKEDSRLDNELHSSRSLMTPGAAALHPDHGRNAIAERRESYSMLGLHTVLALSSPGCYRIWTRRRNLTSRIPTIQRLFMSQFTQGLKGVRCAASVSDDLFSSLPYSLGRALSIWSQHGPSACPSEITPLHSNHCKWQPSVGIENSYAMLPHLPIQSIEALQTAGHEIRLEPSFPLPLPKSCSLPESSSSPLRLSAPELQVPAFDEADASVPACLRSQDDTELKKTEPEKRPKKVSQIRIRKTVPKSNPNLTPMGLPRPKRLKKKEFSLEEIYTNKNYKSPPPTRSLETIFEEPKEKNGALISISQQKRKRILEFQDFTVPRKRKARSKIKVVGSFTRAKKAALQSAELDALLIQKLMDLEAFFANEAEHEQASSS